MVAFTGNNLGERQRDLNKKVAETASRKVDFKQLRDVEEQCDTDRLFKIDVASKYRNIDYIVDVFKSGDPLYISRALKCEWLFTDKYSNVMNCDYLHQNVFPFMSSKMKTKLLSTTSIYVRNESRAADFYTYCRNEKLNNLAFKFLLFTSESFKLELLNKDPCDIDQISHRPNNYLKHFIQKSFDLAHAYIVHFGRSREEIIHELRYLYSVSNSKYLDMLEDIDKQYDLRIKRFGLRLSKHIVTKHKDRVLRNPRTYVKILQNNILVKRSTAEHAKVYVAALLPDIDSTFWYENFCNTYKYIIDLIPLKDRFGFIQKIFNDKYPNKPFETTLKFYDLEYYTMMTPVTRELWALQHIKSEREILGERNDYIWYKFVNYKTAFVEIKKYLMINKDKENRVKIINILIESTKNQRELENLIDFFYQRHVNELKCIKEQFIDKVLYHYNPFRFDENCWTSFNKVLYSLEVYSVTGYNNSKIEYITIALIYHIIKKKEVPEALQHYMDSNLMAYVHQMMNNTKKLDKEEVEMVYQYLFDFYIEKLNKIYDGVAYDDDVKHSVSKYIHIILVLLHNFDKTKSDCPEKVTKLIKLDWNGYSHHAILYVKEEEYAKDITQDELIRILKKDASLIVEKLPKIKNIVEKGHSFKLNLFLRKLKVYYPNDLSKKCVDFFNELLSGENVCLQVAQTAVYGIYLCAEDSYKGEFMKKFTPLVSKIDHTTIDQNLLHIQQAICAFANVSRPPVPLENVLAYLKGDYVQYCLPIFNSYLANLPTPLCVRFVESIIDAPLSVQKHGIRLAFVCFSTVNLVKLITSAWRKTKNVSLRLVIYQALFDKILAAEEDAQTQLYKTLKAFTLDIYEDDDDELFNIITSDRLPKYILGDHIETAWASVAKLPQTSTNLQRVHKVLRCIHQNIKLIRNDVIETIVEEHIKAEFAEKQISENYENKNMEILRWMDVIVTTKWDVTTKYITCIDSDEELASKLEKTKTIMKSFIKKWNVVQDNSYSVRCLCLRFLNDLDSTSYDRDKTCYKNANVRYKYTNVLFENIMKMLQDSFPIEEIYSLILKLNFNIITRKVIVYTNNEITDIPWEGHILTTIRIRKMGMTLANEFGVLLQEFIKKDMYYAIFSQKIENKLAYSSDRVINDFRYYHRNVIDSTDFRVIVCFELIQLNTPETNVYALKLVPLDYGGCYKVEYKAVLNALKKVGDKEFRCLMHHKFTNSNKTFRKY